MAKGKKDELKKPLDKMTVKELKVVALEIPEITGVHGMNKSDLLSAIKAAKGIEEEVKKKGSGTVREVKRQIKALKIKRNEVSGEKDSKMATVYRRRISRLKKKSRKVA
jgi:ABC-type phosphate transport system auxiliary subunit